MGGGSASQESVAELKRVLGGRNSLLAGMAAEIAARWGREELIPDMIAAFDRFLVDGAKVDKQCNAKIAIVNALSKLEFRGDEVFLKGARYIQMEPAFGKPVDTAVDVRIGCAYALARLEHPDALYVLTELLVDSQPGVRAAAAKALGYLGRPESEHLLRLKALTGDADPDVIRECFESLIAMAPERSLDFIGQFLESKEPAVAQYAALAVGESRLSRAYDILRECWDDNISPEVRRMLLLPIALIRSDEAFNFLLEVVRHANVKMASEAVSALNIYASEENIRKIGEIVDVRDNPELTSIFNSEFVTR